MIDFHCLRIENIQQLEMESVGGPALLLGPGLSSWMRAQDRSLPSLFNLSILNCSYEFIFHKLKYTCYTVDSIYIYNFGTVYKRFCKQHQVPLVWDNKGGCVGFLFVFFPLSLCVCEPCIHTFYECMAHWGSSTIYRNANYIQQ